MNAAALIESLECTGPKIAALVGDLGQARAARRPTPNKWSALEIMAHLLDEECKDFRIRLDLVLDDPEAPWPGIDPPGWVSECNYNAWDLGITLTDFLAERRASVVWLRTLVDPVWENTYEHPLLGAITAGDLLASWAAHDLLHLRQLVGVFWLENTAAAERFGTRYAGDW